MQNSASGASFDSPGCTREAPESRVRIRYSSTSQLKCCRRKLAQYCEMYIELSNWLWALDVGTAQWRVKMTEPTPLLRDKQGIRRPRSAGRAPGKPSVPFLGTFRESGELLCKKRVLVLPQHSSKVRT